MPALPHNCDVTGGTLRIYASNPTAGATIYAYRATTSWNAATMTWNTGRPAPAGTPASTTSLSSAGTQQWDVTTLTQELYLGPDYGFLLKDSVDNAALRALPDLGQPRVHDRGPAAPTAAQLGLGIA